MRRSLRQWNGIYRWSISGCVILLSAGVVQASDPVHASARSQEKLWRRTIDLASQGNFQQATAAAESISGSGAIVDQVRSWLKEYEEKQTARKKLDLVDFEKYVGYCRARIERKEFAEALAWSLAAYDCAADRTGFLKLDWIQDLTNSALSAADKMRQDQDWSGAYQIYSQLAVLFEHEPRFQKLEREILTLLRLDHIFKEDANWKERIEKVRWKDAETALRHIDGYYVHEANFKEMAEHGLEQLLLLTESTSAQKRFDGLGNENDRRAFVSRIRARLDRVRAAPSLTWQDCRNHFQRVVRKINRGTVRLPDELIVSELMRGALAPLDDFTTIIWPRASREFDKHTRGDFVGIGISIIKNRKDEIEVVTPMEDTPAYRAGIQSGDIITAVDGVPLKDYSINKVVETITGPEGTRVSINIRRDDKDITFDLERAKVHIYSVKGVRRDPRNEERWDHWLDKERGIGYIRITNFQRNTVEDVDNVLSEMSAEGLKGLVIDLRRNPGGLLDSAWQLTSRFLKRNDVVVETKGRLNSDNQVFDVPGTGAYSDTPLVVLVDERSASASEIVSGAVRDNAQGVVIGESTFGKFSVQNLVPLGRSGAKLKITTARYYLPSGDSLHRESTSKIWGVQPDIPIRLARKETIKVYELWRESNLLGPQKSEEEKTKDAEENAEDKEDAKKTDGDKDDKAEDKSADKTEDGAQEGDDEKEAKLPPLEQPDENLRPKEDPQLDTALLVMRLMLLGDAYPTLATAEPHTPQESAKP
jgi:carboxyl-terminal processing protease